MDNEQPTLIERLMDEADQCRSDGADDIAALLDEAASALREAVPLSAIRPIAVEAIRAVAGCADMTGSGGISLVQEMERTAKLCADGGACGAGGYCKACPA